MSKIFIYIALLSSLLFADIRTIEVNEEIIKSGIPVIDIRTHSEWQETGIVKGAIPITFFDEQGRYDMDVFLKELNKHVSKEKEFALICRTGSRTTAVSEILSKQGYNVVNLKGGMRLLINKGYIPEPFNHR